MAKLTVIGGSRKYPRGPGYWKFETGELPGAMLAYINHVADLGKSYPAPTDEQLGLVILYLRQWVEADGWMDIDGEVAELREVVKRLATVEDVVQFVMACVSVGMDPL